MYLFNYFQRVQFSSLFPSLVLPKTRRSAVPASHLMKAARKRSISRVKTASPSAGFSYDAFRLGVSELSSGAEQAPERLKPQRRERPK